MLQYAVVEISGRQYKIAPGETFKVDYLGDVKTLECDKIIAINSDKGFSVGAPYLKEKLVFEVLETIKEKKIRVATYKAKANTRKVRGSRRTMSTIRLVEDKKSTK